MGVADYIALVASEATDLQVFANGEDLILQRGVNSNIGTGQLAVHQGLYISGILINNSLGTSLDKTDEISVFTNKVGFGVDLDNNANLLFVIYHVHTTPSAATRPDFLAAAARPFSRRNSIAFSTSPSEAVRAFCSPSCHSRFFAQILNILSSKCHFVSSCIFYRCFITVSQEKPESASGFSVSVLIPGSQQRSRSQLQQQRRP